MKIDSIIIAVLYDHFYKMQKRGRKVIPWFQTVAVLAFAIAILFVLLILILAEFFNKGHYSVDLSETEFIIAFILAIALLFLGIKGHYFNSNKHLLYLEKFNSLSTQKQKIFKILVLTIIVALPFILLFFLYLFDTTK
jgi:hypothetical protein